MRRLCLAVTVPLVVCLSIGCGKGKNPQTGGQSSALTPGPSPATYAPRLGVAVKTGDRTCVAMHNANLASGTPITLISPMLPQSFSQAQISGPSTEPCPITKDVDPAVTNYTLQGVDSAKPKLAPFIAVTGTSTPFTIDNNNVRADLDQNGKTETFRACSADDGIHLTAWSGNPLTGTLLWEGLYYEPSNPGLGPACTEKEMAPPPE